MKSTVRVHLELSNAAARVYGHRERLMLERREGESGAHVMLKLLAYAIFFAPGLAIERRVGQAEKPDLVRVDAAGRPAVWVECGQVSTAKLDAVTRRNPGLVVEVVKKDRGSLDRWMQAAARRLTRPERVRGWAFDAGFVDGLCERLCDGSRVVCTVDEGREHLWVEVEGEAFASTIHCRPKGG